jgi:hypothetical protein
MKRLTSSLWRLSTPRALLLLMAGLSLFMAWHWMADAANKMPWHRNLSMDVHHLVDGLSLNSGVPPARVEHPGFTGRFLVALDLRLRHHLGTSQVWNLEALAAAPDPLREFPALVQAARLHACLLVLLLILGAAGLVYLITSRLENACITVGLLAGCSTLLFHGVLLRPELLAGLFGWVVAMICVWQGVACRTALPHQGWLTLAGLGCGLAVLSSVLGAFALLLCYAWCWIAARNPRKPESINLYKAADFRHGMTPAVIAGAMFLLLLSVPQGTDSLGPAAAFRLRAAALCVGLLPLVSLGAGRHPAVDFVLLRLREASYLGAGALASLLFCYAVLCAVMPAPAAAEYIARLLDMLFSPTAFVHTFLTTEPSMLNEWSHYIQEAPFLVMVTPILALGVCFLPRIPAREKSFTALLLAGTMGTGWLLGHGSFHDSYSMLLHVPLLLLWALGLSLFKIGGEIPAGSGHTPWPFPVVAVSILVLLCTAPLRLQVKFSNYQPEAIQPVSDLNITYLYDHAFHPRPYLDLMERHYGSRADFSHHFTSFLKESASGKP